MGVDLGATSSPVWGKEKAGESLMKRYWSVSEIARHFDIRVSAVQRAVDQGTYPEADVVVGNVRGWSDEKVQQIAEHRAKSPRVAQARIQRERERRAMAEFEAKYGKFER